MKYQNITKDDLRNGDGIRVVLWVSGCGHHCEGCQNPITWDPEDGLTFTDAEKNELFAELEKDYVSGITFSGGDPLYPDNEPVILELSKEIKERFPDKTIWLYTGYEWSYLSKVMPSILEYIDILVDGRYVQALRDTQLHWRGSSNQHVIDVQKSLETGEMVLHCDDGPDVVQTDKCPSCGC